MTLKTTRKIKSLYKIIGFLLLILSCTQNPKSISLNQKNPLHQNSAQILFLNLAIETHSIDSSYQVRVTSKSIKSGQLKNNSDDFDSPIENSLKYIILDKDQTLLHTGYIENPLDKFVEFSNEKGEFKRQRVKRKKGVFSLRTQLPKAATFVVIKQLKKDNEDIKLITLDIRAKNEDH